MPKHFRAFLCCLGVNHLDSINAIFKIENCNNGVIPPHFDRNYKNNEFSNNFNF